MNKLETNCEATKKDRTYWKRTLLGAKELRKSIKIKKGAGIAAKMNELDAEYRSHSRKEEVNQGLTAEQAVIETKRCLRLYQSGLHGLSCRIDIPNL